MSQFLAIIAVLMCLPSILLSQSPFPSFTNGNVIAQYLQPTILSIESTTSTGFVLNTLIRSVGPRRSWVCLDYSIAIDSSFSNNAIIRRSVLQNCMPPIPNCLGRGYLDSAVQLSVQISDLQPNKQYFFRIRSRSAYSDFVLSSLDVYFTIRLPQNAPPTSPKISHAQAITTTSAIVRWSTLEGSPTHYGLTVATDSAFQAILPQYRDLAVSDTMAVMNGLLPKTPYFVRVRAVNGIGFSPFSVTRRFQTLPTNAQLFTADNRSSAQGFPNITSVRNGSPFYRLNTNLLSLAALDSLVGVLVQRNLPILEAWSQDNSTCAPTQQTPSELVVRMKEPTTMLAALGFTQAPPVWADSCSCKTFRIYGNFPTSTSVTAESSSFLTLSPNPATEAASIRLSLLSASLVRLTLHDALGREVRTIADGIYPAGQQEFSATLDGLPSGIYFVRGNVGGQVVVRRLAVVR